MTIAAGIIAPMRSAARAKLGRCVRCMRLSASLTLGSWVVLAALIATGAPAFLLPVTAVAVAGCSSLSLAHAVAYVLRGPARAAGCVPCAKRARGVRRGPRRWPWQRRPAVATAGAAGCHTCPKTVPSRPLETLWEISDELPEANPLLRGPLERSAEFRALTSRLAAPDPLDSWQADLRHYFLYRLAPEAGAEETVALFVMSWDYDEPVTAVAITTDPNGGEATMVDLRMPETERKRAVPVA